MQFTYSLKIWHEHGPEFRPIKPAFTVLVPIQTANTLGAKHILATTKKTTWRTTSLEEVPVTVYYPIVVDELRAITEQGTVEEILDGLLRDKQELADNVVVPSDWLKVDQELLARTFP